MRFLCSTRKQAFYFCAVFSGAWMHRTAGSFQLCNVASVVLVLSSPGVLEMHFAKVSRSNFLTAHPPGLPRGGSRFRLCNSNQIYRSSLSDFPSNIVHSHRYLLRVGRRNVRFSTDDDALLSNIAIPGWIITIRSSETIISSRSSPLVFRASTP